MQTFVRQGLTVLAIVCAVWVGSEATATAQRQSSRRATPAPATPARQTQPTERAAPLASDPDVQAADIAIVADVRAKSLIFEAVPNPKVEFPGSHPRSTKWEALRTNLPTPVQPGVTYRNIGIRLKITSVFSDIDRIVSEALGEVPVADTARAADEKATRNPSQPAPPSQTSSTPPRER